MFCGSSFQIATDEVVVEKQMQLSTSMDGLERFSSHFRVHNGTSEVGSVLCKISKHSAGDWETKKLLRFRNLLIIKQSTFACVGPHRVGTARHRDVKRIMFKASIMGQQREELLVF